MLITENCDLNFNLIDSIANGDRVQGTIAEL